MGEVYGPDLMVDLRIGEEQVEWEEGMCYRAIVEGDIGDGACADVDVDLFADFGREFEEPKWLENHCTSR